MLLYIYATNSIRQYTVISTFKIVEPVLV